MTRSETILGLVWIPVHAALLPWLLVLAFQHMLGRSGAAVSDPTLNLSYYAVSFIFVFIFFFRYLKTALKDLIDNILPSLQAIVFAYLFNALMLYLLSLLLGAVSADALSPNTREIIGQTKLNAGTIVVVAVLLAPVVEETLFRGALFGALRTKSRVLAYIVSVLLFAAYHLWRYFLGGFDWTLLLYLLQYVPAGLALAWCYEKSGSLWAPILLHAAINFVSVRILIG